MFRRRILPPLLSTLKRSSTNHSPSLIYIHLIPLFSDNYSYLIIDQKSGKSVCVDPGQAAPIIETFSKLQRSLPLTLDAILATHKHGDHVDGILQLKEKYPSVQVIGTGYEEIPGITKEVFDGETFQIGQLNFQTISTPCHTTGHVCYYLNDFKSTHLFCGDTLFLGGCGRFFEGTPSQMLDNMDKFLNLPSSTKIYCGHEYTMSNLKFLHHLYQYHPDLKRIAESYFHKYETLRCNNLPTIPSSIEDEMKYNAFLKCHNRDIQELVGSLGDPVNTMKKLRELKNNFK